MESAIFGEYLQFWRYFVVVEGLIVFALYSIVLVERIKLLRLVHGKARRFIYGAIAKQIAVLAFITNMLGRVYENWNLPASTNFGWATQIGLIALIIAYGFYDRANIIIRRGGREDEGDGFETR